MTFQHSDQPRGYEYPHPSIAGGTYRVPLDPSKPQPRSPENAQKIREAVDDANRSAHEDE